ncbi:hypothetical protein FYE33_17075 [Salmonella enterica]|nr:hypothetical protein [Salmonella enterica]
MLFAVRKISVSIFDGVSNGGALCEICDFAGGFTGEILRENGQKKKGRNCGLVGVFRSGGITFSPRIGVLNITVNDLPGNFFVLHGD